MMQPFKEGAPGNHGSFLKRCDSRPLPSPSPQRSLTIAPHHPLQLWASSQSLPFSTLPASALDIIHSTLSLSRHL